MAQSTLFLVALVALIAAAAAAAPVPIGGATSVATYEQALINAYSTPSDLGTYASVGSPAGLSGFCAGTYAIAGSDYADGAVSGTTRCTSPAEATIPQVLGSTSFGVNGASSSIQLTAAQVWGIYNGSIKSWTSIPTSGLTGAITPIARNDSSGTTFLVTSWLSKSGVSGVTASDVKWNTGYSGVKYYNGTGGVVNAVKATVGAICYASTGSIIGLGSTPQEAAVQNYATKAFVKGANAVLSLSVPSAATLPACTASWAGVSLINANVNGAYPITTFEYLIARQTSSPFNVTKVKGFLSYTMTSVPQTQTSVSYGFQPLPAAVVANNTKCINALK